MSTKVSINSTDLGVAIRFLSHSFEYKDST